MKKLVLQVSGIVCVSIVLGLGNNFVNPNKVHIAKERPAAETVAESVLADTAVVVQDPVVIDKEQLKHLMERGDIVILDARSPEEYQAGHIPGAVNIPLERLGEFMERVEALPRENWIVTYCDGPPCDKGAQLAGDLFYMDFPRIAIYDAGLNDWRESEEVVR